MKTLEKVRKRVHGDRYEAVELETRVSQAQPSGSDFEVCFYGPSPQFFSRGGKVTAFEYLPDFCDQLRMRGIRTSFASTTSALESFVSSDTKRVLVSIYQEEGGHIPTDPDVLSLIDQADLNFNHPRSAMTIVNKLETNKTLAKAGCNVPKQAVELEKDAPVFSNELDSTAASSFVTTADQANDESRFNAQFLDTRMPYKGREYYTTMRLMCINDQITHTMMRARDAAEGNASVHSANTPQDVDLINQLWQTTLEKYETQFRQIARQVFEAFGDGFYAHDTLIDHATQTAYICETGYKFNDRAYQRHVDAFKHRLPGMKGHLSPGMSAQSAAPIFLDCVQESLARRSISGGPIGYRCWDSQSASAPN